jgi:hypothetical protein
MGLIGRMLAVIIEIGDGPDTGRELGKHLGRRPRLRE